MQQALENIHYKKIWEEVNWKIRHPEAKSLDEAFYMESGVNNALVMTGDGSLYRVNEVEFCESNPYSVGVQPKNNIKIIGRYNYEGGYECKIIGRVITLEDILLLLSKNGKARNEIGIILLENGNLCIKPQTGGMYDFDWEYSKPFYEQSPETWEKISKLINK